MYMVCLHVCKYVGTDVCVCAHVYRCEDPRLMLGVLLYCSSLTEVGFIDGSDLASWLAPGVLGL